MNSGLLISLLVAFSLGFPLQKAAIRLACRFGVLDHPLGRKQHTNATPKLGGLAILLAWILGISCYCLLVPGERGNFLEFFRINLPIFLFVFALGLVDDIRGLRPHLKLTIELGLALVILSLDPQLNAFMRGLQGHFGPVVWIIGMVWIAGVANAVNLIDGLDGLLGTNVILISLSLAAVAPLCGVAARTLGVTMPLLSCAAAAFLFFNRNPARTFLGDNGSLTIGFVFGVSTLRAMSALDLKSGAVGIALIIAYPILDMGLAVWRRTMKKQPIFKGDRVHLHHRLLRLGFSPLQALQTLVVLSAIFQIDGVLLSWGSRTSEDKAPLLVALGSAVSVGLAAFLAVYIIRTVERSWTRRFMNSLSIQDAIQKFAATQEKRETLSKTITIDLEPMLEAAFGQKRERIQALISSLELMLHSSTMLKGDLIETSASKISIHLLGSDSGRSDIKRLQKQIHDRIQSFLLLYNIPCPLEGLPVQISGKPERVA